MSPRHISRAFRAQYYYLLHIIIVITMNCIHDNVAATGLNIKILKHRKKWRAADVAADGRGRVTLSRRWTTCADERYRNAYNIITIFLLYRIRK